MAGDAHVDESHLKGMAKIFNGETMRGRANVSTPLKSVRLYE